MENSNLTVLSLREKQVLRLIMEEYTNLEIASILYLSIRTVEHHRISIMHKLGVRSIVGLVKYAVGEGCVYQ